MSSSYINNINSFIDFNHVNNIVNHENSYNRYSIIPNYWNEIIYMIHEMNVNEMIVPVHNRDYLLGVIAAAQAVEPVTVASASSTFEKFNIDVEHHMVAPLCQAQASSQHCHGHGDDSNARCSICLKCLNAEQEEEDKEEEEEMVKTKCAHIFHSKCLAKWVIQKTTCPMCRNSLTKK